MIITDEEKVKFQEYVERAERIVRARTYRSSNMKKIDSFIADPNQFLEDNRAALLLPNFQVNFDKSFVALAAPSLEGKTQAAFTLRSANPLYFVMAAADAGEGGIQPIYKSFIRHSVFLKTLALEDLSNLGVSVEANSTAPTAFQLHDEKSNVELYVLGFILEIMKQTIVKRSSTKRSNFAQLPGWMQFYARELLPFQCPKISIKTFVQETQKLQVPFCLFLDEFLSEPWSVYVRNLARAVGLHCIVSNTNSNIANLVSKGSEFSREDESNACWSLVFRRLDNVVKSVVDISGYVKTIMSRCAYLETVRPAFTLLFENWFYRCRPGIAIWLAEGMASLIEEWSKRPSDKSVFTLESILLSLTQYVSKLLSTRKDRMVSTLNGQVAKLGLYTHAAYDFPGSNASQFAPFNFIQFLENHLYYLLNPTGSGLDFFLTFRPVRRNGLLRVASLSAGQKQVSYKFWNLQLTSFREDEFFTFLACIFIKLECSPNNLLLYANIVSMTRNLEIANLANLNAIKLSGNHLEVAAAMACVDASHQSGGLEPVFSLRGQDGITWFNNVVANCSHSENFRTLTVQISKDCKRTFNLEKWLKTVHIPFLFGINNSNPYLEYLSDRPATGVFARNYFRTPDIAGIDGSFEFAQYYDDGSRHLRACSIECKNHKLPADASALNTLLLNAIAGVGINPATGAIEAKTSWLPSLFLIFTNDVANPDSVSSLQRTCMDYEVNLYRLTTDMNVVLHHPSWKVFKEPKCVGSIIEIDSILEII